jgi:hypothetical protein
VPRLRQRRLGAHISLVFREMWDSTALNAPFFVIRRKPRGLQFSYPDTVGMTNWHGWRGIDRKAWAFSMPTAILLVPLHRALPPERNYEGVLGESRPAG